MKGNPTRTSSVPDQSASAPDTLDNALVISTAPASPNQIGANYETGDPVLISYFAIARYREDANLFYLFGVSADHQVVSDFDFTSAKDAADSARLSGLVAREFNVKGPGLPKSCA